MASQKKGKSTAGRSTARGGNPARSRAGSAGAQRSSSNVKKKSNGSRVVHDAAFFELQNEIILMVVLVISVLLLLSNFKLGGAVGNAVNGFMFGMFGMLNYLFPILLFCGTAFYLANRGNRVLLPKMLYLCGMLFMVTALIQLMTRYSPDQLANAAGQGSLALKDYFTLAKQYKKGGGIVGGIVCFVFEPLFGLVGSFVVTFALLLVFFMLFSRKAIFAWIARISSERYAEHKVHADERREYYEQRQAERERIVEEKRKAMGERRAKTFLLSEEERMAMAGSSEHMSASETKKEKKEAAKETRNFFGGKTPTGEYVYGCEPFNPVTGEVLRKPERKEEKRRSAVASKAVVRTNPEEQKQPELIPLEKRAEAIERTMEMRPVERERTFSITRPVENESTSVVNQPQAEERATGPAVAKRRGPTVAEELMALGMEKDRQTSGGKTYFEVSPNTPKKEEAVVNYDAVEQADSPLPTKEELSGGGKQTVTTNASGSDPVEPISVEEPEPVVKYEFPSTELLKKPKASKGIDEGELAETAMKLQSTLDSFGVRVTVNNVSCGPSVTRYELLPEQGVKVSKITSLADDIKLNLAAADVRIEAPIPGKAAVGIEVPNKENSTVFLRELIESKEFQSHPSRVAFAVGKDIGGQTVVTDIAKMPHLLIAGATGSGKSVCINTLIMSILYKADPNEVKLIMVDPKVVELSVYNGIPHLMIPVVTDPKKASAALNWAVMEMTDRYNKFAELGVRDLKGYNERVENAAAQGLEEEKYKRLPQIVIIVDELADLMMVAPGEVEDSICRLAQLARAAGLHLVIATQRPSVNVITGVIKANIPSRIAFAVSSAIDSRTILDGAGAEKLLGKGDMLFFPSGFSKPVRVQGAFVSDNEVSAVVDFLKAQTDGTTVNHDVMNKIQSMPSAAEGGSEAGGNGGFDEYFADAGKLIIEKDKASIGMLQRAYKIGFNRAARIMDQLAEAGVVGPEEGTKPRKVLMSAEEFENFLQAN